MDDDRSTHDYIERCIEKAALSYGSDRFDLAAFYHDAAQVSLMQLLLKEVAALRADLAKRG